MVHFRALKCLEDDCHCRVGDYYCLGCDCRSEVGTLAAAAANFRNRKLEDPDDNALVDLIPLLDH